MDSIMSVVMNEDTKDEHKLSYLIMSNEMFGSEKEQDTIIKYIKLQMSSQKTRYTGLTFLTSTIPRLNNEIFSKNCMLWLQLIFKNLQESKEARERVLCYKVLNQILIRIDELNLPNLTRELSICLVPNLLQYLCEFRADEICFAVNTIALSATLFPGVISAKRNFIETRILETINSIIDCNKNAELIKTIGFCYTKIYLCGSSIPSKWREVLSKLMNTLNEFLNLFDMLSVVKHIPKFKFEDEQLDNFYSSSPNMVESLIRNSKKLSFLSAALSCLITGHYPTALPLPVEAILECLTNLTLVASLNSTQTLSGDTFVLSHLTPPILRCVFDLLTALLTSCKTNLIIYTRTINQISLATLEWLNKKGAFGKPIHLEIRCRCFSFLHQYLALLGINSCFTKSETASILSFVLCDIRPFELKATSSELSDLTSKNLLLCTKNAIKVLKSLLNYSLKSFPDAVLFDAFQSGILHVLLNIYRNWFDLKLPYKDEQCRKELLESLKLLTLNADRSINVPLETTFAILTEAQRIDNSLSVKSLSEDILTTLNFILRSRIPNMRSNSVLTAMPKQNPNEGLKSLSVSTFQQPSVTCDSLLTTSEVVKNSPQMESKSKEVSLDKEMVTLGNKSESDIATNSKKRKKSHDNEVICIDYNDEINDNPQKAVKTVANDNTSDSTLTTTILEIESIGLDEDGDSTEKNQHKSQDEEGSEESMTTQADEILQYLVED